MKIRQKKYHIVRSQVDTHSQRTFSLAGDLTQSGSDTNRQKIRHKGLNSLCTDNYLLESSRILNDWNIGIARKDL